MTEEDAKDKWCPFARVGSDGNKGSGWNRPERESFGHRAKIGGENHCIVSACMAWRVTGPVHERGPVVERMRAMPGSKRPTGDDWGYEQSDPNSAALGGDWVRYEFIKVQPHGFCGLAGRPD